MTTRPRICVLDDWQHAALTSANWSELQPIADIDFHQAAIYEEDLACALASYDILIVMRERTRFPRHLLEQLPKLRLIVTTGSRNAAIDLNACSELGITVCGTDSVPDVTAELTWALILTAAKRLDIEIPTMRTGQWLTSRGNQIPLSLRSKTLGILGLGRVGSAVARIGRAFGMDVIAWSQNLTAEHCKELGVTLVSKHDLFTTSDIISLHVRLSERTRGLISTPELTAMKPTAWLVNTSRGEIIETAPLIQACRDQTIAGACLDVFDQEPLPAHHQLRALPNVILTPHLGFITREQYQRWYTDAIEDIRAYLDGKPIRVLTPLT